MAKKKSAPLVREYIRYILFNGPLYMQRKLSFGRWRYIYCFDEELNEIDQELNKLVKKAKDLCQRRSDAAAYIRSEKKKIEEATRERHGLGKGQWKRIPKDKRKPKLIDDFLGAQPQTWRDAFNPKWLKKVGQIATNEKGPLRSRIGNDDREALGSVTAYINEADGGSQLKATFENGQFMVDRDVDHVVNYKNPSEKQNQQSKKQRRNNQQQHNNRDDYNDSY